MAVALAESNHRRDRFAAARERRRAILRGFQRWCVLQQARIARDLEQRVQRIRSARDLLLEDGHFEIRK
jgi:hypothetical protein